MKKNKNMLNGYTTTPVILSGREGSMDSSANAFRMTTEGGRSMVEMLGVLAIIGLLSNGGIAGYKNAMNKHAANEIINEVNKRAVSAAGQLLLGKDFNLAEFGNATVKGCTIAKKDGVATGSFGLTVTGMDKGVCKQLWDMSKDWSVPVDVMLNSNDTCGETNTFTYLFANDLSKNVAETPISYKTCESGCDTRAETCDTATGKCVSACTQPGFYYSSSGCKEVTNTLSCSKEGDTACPGNCCDTKTMMCVSAYYDGSNYHCQYDKIKCNKNSDCHTGQFCLVSGNSNSPSVGRCTDVSEVGGYSIPSDANAFFKNLVRSQQRMNWWSANNWCQAQGKHLASLADLGIVKPGSCYVKGTSSPCDYTDSTKWTEANSYYNALTSAFGNESYLWTSDSSSSSGASSVALNYGYVNASYREDILYALCR